MPQECCARNFLIFGEGRNPHFFAQYWLDKSDTSVRVVVEICHDARVMGQSPPIQEEIVGVDLGVDWVVGCGLIPSVNNAMIELSKETEV
jgi:hypothetical protein